MANIGKQRFIHSNLSGADKTALVRSVRQCLTAIQNEAICPTGRTSQEAVFDHRIKLLEEYAGRLVSMFCVFGDPTKRAKDIESTLELMQAHNGSLEGAKALLEYASDFRRNAPMAGIWVDVVAIPLEAKVAAFLSKVEAQERAYERLFANQ